MSDSFRTKKACKNKKLTGSHLGYEDEYDNYNDDFVSNRYGNQRNSVRKDKIRDRKKRRRAEKEFGFENVKW